MVTRFKMGLAACLFMVACSPVEQTEQVMIEACARTINEYNWMMDHPGEDPEATALAFGELFTENAVLNLNGNVYQGRPAIIERYTNTRLNWQSLTYSTNIIVTPVSEAAATATSYKMQYLHRWGQTVEEGIVDPSVAEMRDEMVMAGGRCRFASRVSHRRFNGERQIIPPPF